MQCSMLLLSMLAVVFAACNHNIKYMQLETYSAVIEAVVEARPG